jgi:hypothetical protein
MHRRPAEANLPTQYGAARSTRDAGGHEIDEFKVEGLELDGLLVREDDIFTISERKLAVDEEAAFAAAKKEELQSFFDNAVWKYANEADLSRTMKARPISAEVARRSRRTTRSKGQTSHTRI